MLLDRPLSLKLSFFNGIGLLVAVLSPTIIDPLLTTHVLYGRRCYPHAGWLMLLSILSFSTYFLLDRTRCSTRNLLVSFLSIVIPGLAASFAFPPERPHMAVLSVVFAVGLLSFLTVFLRQNRDEHIYLHNPSLVFEGKLERLKATVAVWQLIAIYGAAGYLAFVIFWISVSWTISQAVVTDKREQLLFGSFFGVEICIFSIAVLVGPLNEAFRMTFDSTKKLSAIKDTRDPDSAGKEYLSD